MESRTGPRPHWAGSAHSQSARVALPGAAEPMQRTARSDAGDYNLTRLGRGPRRPATWSTTRAVTFPRAQAWSSYQAAVDRGAQALEISVGITSDNVLVCLHDLTLDRTTT